MNVGDFNKYIREINKKRNPIIHNAKLHASKFSKEDTTAFVKGSIEDIGCYMGEIDEGTINSITREVLKIIYK